MVKAQVAYNEMVHLMKEAGVEDASTDAGLLFEHVCGCTRFERDDVSDEEWAAMLPLAERRAKREPLQYLLGSWPFLGLELLVGPGVLIPRPETEEVCFTAAKLLRGASPVILDLCAGSGALSLGLQSLVPQAHVMAAEGDEAAFAWLQKNIKAYDAKGGRRPDAVLADVFTFHGQLPTAAVDLIVSNPPYVTEEEYGELEPELHYEPKQALVADEEGLAFYRAIARDYGRALKKGGYIVFEVGYKQGAAVARILVSNGFVGVGLRKDSSGLQRIVVGMKG